MGTTRENELLKTPYLVGLLTLAVITAFNCRAEPVCEKVGLRMPKLADLQRLMGNRTHIKQAAPMKIAGFPDCDMEGSHDSITILCRAAPTRSESEARNLFDRTSKLLHECFPSPPYHHSLEQDRHSAGGNDGAAAVSIDKGEEYADAKEDWRVFDTWQVWLVLSPLKPLKMPSLDD
jgi:hypothetical protein